MSTLEVRERSLTSNGHPRILRSSMASTSALSTLPLEIKADILSFADQRTLAVACRSSLALLQLAGPLLYHSIEITSLRALDLLFCFTVGLFLPWPSEPRRDPSSPRDAHPDRLPSLCYRLALPIPLSHGEPFRHRFSGRSRTRSHPLPGPLSDRKRAAAAGQHDGLVPRWGLVRAGSLLLSVLRPRPRRDLGAQSVAIGDSRMGASPRS